MTKKTASLGTMTRTVEFGPGDVQIQVRAAEDGRPAQTVFRFPLTSEYPVLRFGFNDPWDGIPWYEVLSHDPADVDLRELNNKAPLLHMHDPYDQIGVIDKADLEKGRTFVDARFSSVGKGPDFRTDVEEGVRTKASARYAITARQLVKTGKKEGDPNTYRCSWRGIEGSICSLAADPTAGPGRSANGEERELYPIVDHDGEPVMEETRTMENPNQDPAQAGSAPAAAATITVGDQARSAVAPQRNREQDVQDILGMGNANGLSHNEISQALRDNITPDQFASRILSQRTVNATIQPAAEAIHQLSLQDRMRYSYRRAIAITAGIEKCDGVEAEYHSEISRAMPSGQKGHGGVYAPIWLGLPRARGGDGARGALLNELGLPVRGMGDGSRAYPLDSVTTNEGKETVFTQQGEFIELLRNALAVGALGARTLTSLVGPVSFPRQTGAATATWYTEEAAAVSDSMLALDTTSLTPKTLIGTTGYTRQLLAQDSVGIEMLVREDLALIHALALDLAALIGAGSGGVPKGIALQTGVKTVDFGAGSNANAAPSFAKLVDMQGQVADANAMRGSLGYLFTALCAATARKTLEFPTAPGGMPIWQGRLDDGSGIVAGYKAIASNQAGKAWLDGAPTGGSEHGLFFGNFRELLIGLWNAIEFVVDNVTLKKRAIIEVASFQLADTTVRHGASFCIGQNVIP